MTFRQFMNGIRYGSPAGPGIEIDWQNREITLHRMSARLTRRTLGWLTHKAEPPKVLGDVNVQWVLAGFQDDMGQLVLASDTVTKSDMSRRIDGYDKVMIKPGGNPTGNVPRWRITVTYEMADFMQIRVGDRPGGYRAAIDTVLKKWGLRG